MPAVHVIIVASHPYPSVFYDGGGGGGGGGNIRGGPPGAFHNGKGFEK